jgi:hypothetical protein
MLKSLMQRHMLLVIPTASDFVALKTKKHMGSEAISQLHLNIKFKYFTHTLCFFLPNLLNITSSQSRRN